MILVVRENVGNFVLAELGPCFIPSDCKANSVMIRVIRTIPLKQRVSPGFVHISPVNMVNMSSSYVCWFFDQLGKIISLKALYQPVGSVHEVANIEISSY